MIEYQLTLNFIIAILLGILIGLEREYSQSKFRQRKYGGIRTFSLIALLGAFAGFFSQEFTVWIGIVAFAAIIILIAVSHFFFLSRHGIIGITTEIAGILTFFIGMLSVTIHTSLAIILAVIITLVLYERTALHSFAAKLTKEEIYSTIKFAIIAFVILPLLPNEYYGIYNFFNPRNVWLIVVLVSGISFLGYIAARFYGVKGINVASFLGGFASSTATSISLIGQKTAPGYANIMGIISANTAMMIKILVMVYILQRGVFSHIIIPVGLMVIASGAAIALLSRHSKNTVPALKLQSPFMIMPALKFAAIFITILFGINIAISYFSSEGAYVFSFLSGLFDADGTALAALQLSSDGLFNIAAISVVLAIIANTLSKGLLSLFMAGWKFSKKLALPLGIIILVGVLSLWLVF